MPFDFDSLWEFASVTDPSVLRVLLKSSPDWAIATRVESGACGACWQVPHYESVGGPTGRRVTQKDPSFTTH
jgi:hypothetical protein